MAKTLRMGILRMGTLRMGTLGLGIFSGGCSDWSLTRNDTPDPAPVVVEESFAQDGLPKVDVLWVIDNTASMATEQTALGPALEEFVDVLTDAGVAWQIGVISTDVSDDTAGVLQGDPWIITPSVDSPAAALVAAADLGTTGASPEAGLGAVWLALEEPLRSGSNRGFYRDDAAMHVVVVSDSDDMSTGVLGSDPAAAFLDAFQASADEDRPAFVLSALVGPDPDGCASEDGSTAAAGSTYIDVAEATGGVVASVCEPDLTGVAAAIGDAAITWPDTFMLQAVPVVDSVRVAVDGTRLDDGWSADPSLPAIVFQTPPAPGATISVRYEVEE